jgi:hypothetical protein
MIDMRTELQAGQDVRHRASRPGTARASAAVLGAAALALLLVLVGATTPARADTPFDRVLAPYLRIQAQLANDTSDTVKADADAMAAAAAALGTAGAPIASAARELSAASGLAAARDAFGKVSDALLAYTDATQAPVGADTARAYCPMVKKSWLQKGEAIRNPYFGKSMLGCGVIKKRG